MAEGRPTEVGPAPLGQSETHEWSSPNRRRARVLGISSASVNLVARQKSFRFPPPF
jgi:hypothetical protein